jgi:hypothetical protein
MSSPILERLNSYAGVTSRLGLGIMVHHYKFIILTEVLASHASDDRPHTPLSSGFKHEAPTSPCTRRTDGLLGCCWLAGGDYSGTRTRSRRPLLLQCVMVIQATDRCRLRVRSLQEVRNINDTPQEGARCSVVRCGTTLQAAMSRVLIPIRRIFSIYLILWPWGRLSL